MTKNAGPIDPCEYCGRPKANVQHMPPVCFNIHVCRDMLLKRAEAAEAELADWKLSAQSLAAAIQRAELFGRLSNCEVLMVRAAQRILKRLKQPPPESPNSCPLCKHLWSEHLDAHGCTARLEDRSECECCKQPPEAREEDSRTVGAMNSGDDGIRSNGVAPSRGDSGHPSGSARWILTGTEAPEMGAYYWLRFDNDTTSRRPAIWLDNRYSGLGFFYEGKDLEHGNVVGFCRADAPVWDPSGSGAAEPKHRDEWVWEARAASNVKRRETEPVSGEAERVSHEEARFFVNMLEPMDETERERFSKLQRYFDQQEQSEREVAELRKELESRKANEVAALKEMAKARSRAMDIECDVDLLRWLGHDKVEEFASGSLVKKLWDKAKELESTLHTERRRVTWHRENVSKALGSYHGVDLDEPLTLEAIEKELSGENGLVASKEAGWALANARLADIDTLRTENAELQTELDRVNKMRAAEQHALRRRLHNQKTSLRQLQGAYDGIYGGARHLATNLAESEKANAELRSRVEEEDKRASEWMETADQRLRERDTLKTENEELRAERDAAETNFARACRLLSKYDAVFQLHVECGDNYCEFHSGKEEEFAHECSTCDSIDRLRAATVELREAREKQQSTTSDSPHTVAVSKRTRPDIQPDDDNQEKPRRCGEVVLPFDGAGGNCVLDDGHAGEHALAGPENAAKPDFVTRAELADVLRRLAAGPPGTGPEPILRYAAEAEADRLEKGAGK